jgi:hypothetical protein
MEELQVKALNRLISRRNKLQEAYDALIGDPASYGITGSVSATNRRYDELRKELSAIDEKITALLGRGGVAGMETKIPDYHNPFIFVRGALDGRE